MNRQKERKDHKDRKDLGPPRCSGNRIVVKEFNTKNVLSLSPPSGTVQEEFVFCGGCEIGVKDVFDQGQGR